MASTTGELKAEIEKLKHVVLDLPDGDCTDEENERYAKLIKQGKPLPDGIKQYRLTSNDKQVNKFYEEYNTQFPDEDIAEYLRYKQIALLMENVKLLSSVKKYLYFFYALAIAGLIIGLFFGFR